MSDETVLDGLEFDVDDLLSPAGVALAVAHAVLERLRAGDLRAVEKIGKLFSIVAPDWTPSFGPPEPWDPSKHEYGIIIDGHGNPVCTVSSRVITRP